jgi:hypothetical protein
MLTCRSFVYNFITSLLTNRIVYMLSQLIVIARFSSFTCSSLSSLKVKITSLATWDSASNSASVVNVVTVSYLLAL